jgi:Fungal N-terminal domain of STAND proteins
MEPISVISSISGLVATTLQATQLVVRLATETKDAPREIVMLRSELIALSDTVIALQDLMLRSDKWSPLPANMMTALESCGTTIRTLASKLDSSAQSRASLMRLRRSPFTKKEMGEVMQQISSLRSTLMLYTQVVT